MNVRAMFCSVGSLLNAPAIAMSRVKRYQSRHSDASCGFFDADRAAPISYVYRPLVLISRCPPVTAPIT